MFKTEGGCMEDQQKESAIFSEDTIYGVISYLWILCLIPILTKKKSEFIRFHSRQGFMLLIIEIALGVIGIIPLIGQITYTLGMVLCTVLSIVCIVQVLGGKKWAIPVIGKFVDKIRI